MLVEYSASYCIVTAEVYCREYRVDTFVNTAATLEI